MLGLLCELCLKYDRMLRTITKTILVYTLYGYDDGFLADSCRVAKIDLQSVMCLF